MSKAFDYIQTLFVDNSRVSDATDVMITAVELFFKTAPEQGNQGVSVWLCETQNGVPTPGMVLKNSTSYLPKSLINTDDLAQAGTIFTFKNPVVVKTNRSYGVCMKFESDAYSLWTNKKGDALLDLQGKTNNPSAGSTANFEGSLYSRTNSNELKELSEEDLKFIVNVAKFKSLDSTINLIPKDYEFFTIRNRNNVFVQGEWVYKETANAAGTLSVNSVSTTITGSGTALDSHSVGDRVFISNGSTTDVLTILGIANSTSMEVDRNPSFSLSSVGYKTPVSAKLVLQDIPRKEIILVDSNSANSTFRFEEDDVIIGAYSGANAEIRSLDHKTVDLFNAKFLIGTPSIGNYTLRYKFANTSNNITDSWSNFDLFNDKNQTQQLRILSRSNEVVGSSLYGDRKKSAVVELQFNITSSEANLFQAPFLDGDELDMVTTSYDINNVYTDTVFGIENYDTEVGRDGLARCKYISKSVSFEQNRYAEDINVTIGAFRPYGTQIRVYAKLHNSNDSEPFDDKAWTPLVLQNNIDTYTIDENLDSLVEYSYGLPQYPDIKESLSVDLTTQGNSTVLTASDISSDIPAGSVVRLFDRLLPENHEVFKILASNTTSFTVNRDVTNVNIPVNPSIDVLKYKTTAWNNIANDNVARYFTTTTNQEMDGFNTMQIKVVLLSESSHLVPKVEQLQAIGVSA